MNSVLMDLYLKHIQLSTKDVTFILQNSNTKFKSIMNELCDLEESIYTDLNKEKKAIYDEILYHRVKLEDLKISYAFTEGFILAMKIAMEITTTKTNFEILD